MTPVKILDGEQVALVLDADHEWIRGTTENNMDRESDVSWLDRSRWQWLYNIIDGWMIGSWPQDASMPDFHRASSIQMTRYRAPS